VKRFLVYSNKTDGKSPVKVVILKPVLGVVSVVMLKSALKAVRLVMLKPVLGGVNNGFHFPVPFIKRLNQTKPATFCRFGRYLRVLFFSILDLNRN
jgi:hypothetical protein